jgi:hypothetical protein
MKTRLGQCTLLFILLCLIPDDFTRQGERHERLLLCINVLAHDDVRPFFLLSLYEHQHIVYVSSDMRTILLADWVEKLEEVLLVLQ